MAHAGQRKCLSCGEFFDPDHRNRGRQRYCPAEACRRACKAASQSAWLAQPQNSGYFRDPLHAARMKAWRAANPGGGLRKPRKTQCPPVLQDSLISQVPELMKENVIRGETAVAPGMLALQELLNAPSLVLAGLIAHLFEATLQEDIVAATRCLAQLGQDILNRRHL